MKFKPIQNERVADTIIRQIETLILRGVLSPGEQLPAERDLAKSLDVSRPSLREAIRELETRGLIIAKPGGGNFIAEIVASAFSKELLDLFSRHQDAVFDYLEFRREIEADAASFAAMRATEADREIIRAKFEAMVEAHNKPDPSEEAEIDTQFHMSIVEAAHNIVMLHMMRSIYDLLRRGVFYNRTVLYDISGARTKLLGQHREIYESVMAQDPVRARETAQAHMDFVINSMRDAERYQRRHEIALKKIENIDLY